MGRQNSLPLAADEEKKTAYAIALHMHQPLIPAGTDDLPSAPIISNLKYMMDHPNDGDNHNAAVFHWCYKRMGDMIPQLVQDGKRPRIMLDYSGSLLYGLLTSLLLLARLSTLLSGRPAGA